MPGGTRGRMPKPASQRRRRNVPKVQGAAQNTTQPAARERPELGIEDAHPTIEGLWDAVQDSAEAPFYSDADWQRLRAELWYGNRLMTGEKTPGAQAWASFQSGLSELMISPAVKRRAGIEMKPHTSDPDEDAAVAQLDDYRTALGAV